ncbi:MAG: ribonuclease HIII [Kiritimatiellae bacterium]|nr:ribonuclease HIII [Kiritimatiellia bacterium]
MVERTSFTYKLSEQQQKTLITILKQGNYRPVSMEHTIIAGEIEDCRIALYKSGKCLVQGKKASEFVMFVLEPAVLESVGLGYEDVLNPDLARPHIGIDESGKGDFFGPLVVAGAYIDQTLIDTMREMDVKDSKNISSDKKAIEMGRDLRELLGKRYTVIKIGPNAYNRLYHQMRNVNSILAWAHARAIENMLNILPDCPRAISDQFGSKEQVKRALMKKGREIELIQRHKAESDLAVAAASIIAREGFLRALKEMEKNYKIEFHKGASPAVIQTGIELGKKHGPKILLETAKCHFKTADTVLKELKTDRSILGPEGQTVSKPYQFHYHKRTSNLEKSE